MVEKNIFDGLPYYVKLEDTKAGGIIKHICDLGIQPEYESMRRILTLLDSAFDPRYISSNNMIEDMGKMLGLFNYEDHWIGIGINPNWTDEKKRNVVENIFDYWKIKGVAGSLEKALLIWGTDEVNPSLPFKLREEIVLQNTILHRIDRVSLWSYYTPFNHNYLVPLSVQRRLGVGDRWERRKDYVDDRDIKKIQTNYIWDELTEIEQNDLSIPDSLSIVGNYGLISFLKVRAMTIKLEFSNTTFSRKMIEQNILVPETIPPLSSLQRTGCWDKNILVNLEFKRVRNQDISNDWKRIGERLNTILLENVDITKTPRVIYHCNSDLDYEIHRKSEQHILEGNIEKDYPILFKMYNANNFRLMLITTYTERSLIPKNVYWKNELGKNNYHIGNYLLNNGNYEFPNGKFPHLILEFSLISTIDELEGILEWTLKIDDENIENMRFEYPLSFKPSETLYLSFDIFTTLK